MCVPSLSVGCGGGKVVVARLRQHEYVADIQSSQNSPLPAPPEVIVMHHIQIKTTNNIPGIIYQVSYVSVERWNRPVRRLITVWHTVRPHVSPIRREGAAGTRGRTGIRTAQPVRTNNYVLVHAPNDTFRAHASAKKNEQKTKHITSTSSRPRINRIRCVGRKNYRYVLLILVPGRELDS